MNRIVIGLLAGAALALLPLVAFAEDGDKRGLILRVDGDFTLARAESVGTVVVINGDAQVEGTVRDALVVIEGTATVNGTVEGSVTVINGTLYLAAGSSVKDVNLIRSDLNRDERATVTGDVHKRENVAFRGAWLLFSAFFWVGTTLAVVVVGLAFAAVGGRQLLASARALTGSAGTTVLAALALWIGGPIVGVLAFVTVVGIPLGLGILLFVLPALWLLGYVVAGTRLGGAITGMAGRTPAEHPYAAAALGLVLLQLVLLIPGIGWLVVGLAGLWGSGALLLLAWRAARGAPPEDVAAAGPEAAGPPAAPA